MIGKGQVKRQAKRPSIICKRKCMGGGGEIRHLAQRNPPAVSERGVNLGEFTMQTQQKEKRWLTPTRMNFKWIKDINLSILEVLLGNMEFFLCNLEWRKAFLSMAQNAGDKRKNWLICLHKNKILCMAKKMKERKKRKKRKKRRKKVEKHF